MKNSINKITGLQVGYTTEWVVLDSGAWRAVTKEELSKATLEKEVNDTAMLKAEISSAIQSMLDAKAAELRWDDIKSARAAAGIPLPADASVIEQAILDEAIKLSQWYLKCWAKASELEALGAVMTVDEVLAQMPVYVP